MVYFDKKFAYTLILTRYTQRNGQMLLFVDRGNVDTKVCDNLRKGKLFFNCRRSSSIWGILISFCLLFSIDKRWVEHLSDNYLSHDSEKKKHSRHMIKGEIVAKLVL